jgi:hypothetical protein
MGQFSSGGRALVRVRVPFVLLVLPAYAQRCFLALSNVESPLVLAGFRIGAPRFELGTSSPPD